MAKESLQYIINKRALNGLTNDRTKTIYKRATRKFVDWTKGKKMNKFDKISGNEIEVLQEYEKYLETQNYTPESIHTYLAPVAKGLGVNLNKIEKPKRTVASHVKGKHPEANKQGQNEKNDEKYKRVVEFQRMVGIRREELSHLKREDVEMHNGNLCVVVRSGKGGRLQYQLIHPKYANRVKEIMNEVKPGENVFSKAELNNHIAFHSDRAELAREMYNEYAKMLENPQNRAIMKQALMREFEQHDSNKNHPGRRNNFIKTLDEANKPIELRGDNRYMAIKKNRPVTYDRLAVTAVSVFHLAHWRNDVTIKNYLNNW